MSHYEAATNSNNLNDKDIKNATTNLSRFHKQLKGTPLG